MDSHVRRVVFRDLTGQQGSITEGLAVNYEGRWEGEIKECLDRITEDYESDEMFNHIVVELPERAPVYRVERADVDTHADGR